MLTVHTTPRPWRPITRTLIANEREALHEAYAGGDLKYPVRSDVYDMRMRQLTWALRSGDSPWFTPMTVSADVFTLSAVGSTRLT